MTSQGCAEVFSVDFVMLKSAVGVTLGSVFAVVMLSLPSLLSVGVAVVTVLERLPVAPVLILPVSFMTVTFPFGISGRVVDPVHSVELPPSTLNIGFSICEGSESVIVGILAVEGPLLVTVTV